MTRTKPFATGDVIWIHEASGDVRAATVSEVEPNGKLHAKSKDRIFGGSAHIEWTIQPNEVADMVSKRA